MLSLVMHGVNSLFRGEGYVRDITRVDAAAFKDLHASLENLLVDLKAVLVMQNFVGISSSFELYCICLRLYLMSLINMISRFHYWKVHQ